MRRDEAFEWWFSGVVDSKGWFEVAETNDGAIRVKLSMTFRPTELLLGEEIISNLGFGSLKPTKERRGSVFGNIRSRLNLVFNTIDHCVRVCEILDRRRLRGDKLLVYSLWRDAVDMRVEEAKKPLNKRWPLESRKRIRKMIKEIRKLRKSDTIDKIAS